MSFLLKMFAGNPLMMVWIALGIAAVSGSAGGYGGWMLNGWRLGTMVAEKETQLATCNGSLSRTQDANAAFATAVKHQTDAIQTLAEEGRKRDEAAAVATAEAKVQGAAILSKADSLLKKPLPMTAAGDCSALAADLVDLLRERKSQ